MLHFNMDCALIVLPYCSVDNVRSFDMVSRSKGVRCHKHLKKRDALDVSQDSLAILLVSITATNRHRCLTELHGN